jgi:hypothetical protein
MRRTLRYSLPNPLRILNHLRQVIESIKVAMQFPRARLFVSEKIKAPAVNDIEPRFFIGRYLQHKCVIIA